MSEQPSVIHRTVHIFLLEHESALGDDQLREILDWSPAEFDCTSKFRHQGAKTSWCLSRLLLRDKLSELFGICDAARHLSYGTHGKPYISGCDIYFNWSHTDGCVALIIALGAEVGIDIESIGIQYPDYIDIAGNLFLAGESAWIGLEPGPASWERFLSLFVQKEAWIKATGQGLSQPIFEAPAIMKLPPFTSSGRILLEVGKNQRYFLAADASIGGIESQFVVEHQNFQKGEHRIP